MNGRNFLLILLIVTAPVSAERHSAGIFFSWGAFVEAAPRRCFAIARPPAFRGTAAASPFVSVSFSAARPGEVHARLRQAPRAGSSVLLRIDGRSFPLAARGRDAWLADPQASSSVLGLMRTGRTLAVESRSAAGGRMRDLYPLRGAAGAIDAAAVACARPA